MNTALQLLESAIRHDFPTVSDLDCTNICFCARKLLEPTQATPLYHLLSYLTNANIYFSRIYAIFGDEEPKCYLSAVPLNANDITSWAISELKIEQYKCRKELTAFAIFLSSAPDMTHHKTLLISKK